MFQNGYKALETVSLVNDIRQLVLRANVHTEWRKIADGLYLESESCVIWKHYITKARISYGTFILNAYQIMVRFCHFVQLIKLRICIKQPFYLNLSLPIQHLLRLNNKRLINFVKRLRKMKVNSLPWVRSIEWLLLICQERNHFDSVYKMYFKTVTHVNKHQSIIFI